MPKVLVCFDSIPDETEKSFTFRFDDTDVCLPKSQIDHVDATAKTIEIPLWLAIDREIDCYID